MFETQIVPFDRVDAIALAVRYLQNDEIIAAPTDTVYGVMARYESASAIEKIYAIKERPHSKAIPILIGSVDQLKQITHLSGDADLNGLMDKLIGQWWPGPLTLILPASQELPIELTAGQKTVAVRLPDHKRLRELIQISGPLAATSANLSGGAETISSSAVMAQLADRLSIIFDGGICGGGVGSTIVDLTGPQDGPPTILRAGPLADKIKPLLLSDA